MSPLIPFLIAMTLVCVAGWEIVAMVVKWVVTIPGETEA